MLQVIRVSMILRMLDAGPARMWLGPAIRGAVGAAWKAQVCRYRPRERLSRWRYCAGCSHLEDCSYGRSMEPEFRADGPAWHGQRRATPRLVISPAFPVRDTFRRDDLVPLSITMIGPSAAADVQALLDALVWTGSYRGLGDGRTPFEIAGEGEARRLDLNPENLPRKATAGEGRLSRLKVELTTPLILKDVTNPSLSSLFRAAIRAVGQVLALHGRVLEADYAGMIEVANQVRLCEHDFRAFEQQRKSNRTRDRWPTRGVTGWGIYEDVPLCLVPWLEWGAMLHIGQDRGTGAGAMRLEAGDRPCVSAM